MAKALKAEIRRFKSTDEGTRGYFEIQREDSILVVSVLELPWRNNERNYSCIPTGTYKCVACNSEKFGKCYMIQDVPGRSGILIHSGNWAGDVRKGYKTDSEGCPVIGLGVGTLDNQLAVLQSRKAKDMVFRFTEGADLELKVIDNVDKCVFVPNENYKPE